VDQFIACFADANGADLGQFMRWYSQAGTPDVAVTVDHDAKKQTCRLEIAQTVPPTPGQPTKQPMVIPIAFGLMGADGRDLPLVLSDGRKLERGVIILTKPSETFEFSGIAQRPVPSLNRGFSAPVKLSANMSSDDLRFMAARDSDPFNRWQALQTLATALLIDNGTAIRKGETLREDAGLMAAFAAVLADRNLEPAFVALALTPPSEADIARDIGRDVDPEAIFNARRALRTAMAAQLGAALQD